MNCKSCGRVVYLNTTVCSCGANVHQAPITQTNRGPQTLPTAEAVAAHIEQLRAKAGMRRNIFRPGESYGDYLAALQASGKRKAEFDAERLAQRGWTPEHETEYQRHAAMVGFRL